MDQCRRAAQCGAPNYARGDSDFKDVLTLWRGRTRTTWMPQQDGDEGHGGEGRGTSGERGADDDAAAAVAALALHAGVQRRSLCLMQRRASRPRCPNAATGALAQLFAVRRSIAGRAAAAGGGNGRLGERAGGLSGPQLHTRTVCALTIAYLCPCGTPACPDAAARARPQSCLERHPFLKTVLGSPQQLDFATSVGAPPTPLGGTARWASHQDCRA